MKQIILFPKGSITPKDKERMSNEGYCAVECEDPSKAVVAIPAVGIAPDSMLLCALEAMSATSAYPERAKFTDNLFRELKKREDQQPK